MGSGNQIRISLCMILRDEADNLPRSLASVQGVVDEICVVDTGSVDGTPDLARSWGARVEKVEWTDDFAAARNASLEMARGDWVLVLDADEVLEGEDPRASLEAFAAAQPARAGRLGLVDQGHGVEVVMGVSEVTRFFPMARHARFAGRIHEQLEFAGCTPARAPVEGLRVRHWGYGGCLEQQRGKQARNLRLLARELEDRPGCAYLHYQVGLAHAACQEPAAALPAFRAALRHSGPTEPFCAHLAESMAYALRQLGRHAEAMALMDALVCHFPGRSDTVFLHALCAMDLGQLRTAGHGFRRCLGMPVELPEGGPHNAESRGLAAAQNLGLLYEVLREPAKARYQYRLALSHRPGYQPALAGLGRLAPPSSVPGWKFPPAVSDTTGVISNQGAQSWLGSS